MVALKPLHLAASVGELQSNGKVGDVSKIKIKQLCESSDKVWKKANENKDLGDEEEAYVLFFKYIELIQKIRSHAEYKKDEKYYSSMYNFVKNYKKSILTLESLNESLEKRYSERLKEEKKGALRAIDEELKSVKQAKSGKLDINYNSDHFSSTPISHPQKNGLPKEVEEPKDYIITHKKLHSIIEQKSTSFFILDTRSQEDYENSHMTLAQSINIPEHVLKPGTTAATIGKSLKIQDRCQWDRRTNMDMLIISDWVSEDFLPGTPVSVLRDALTRWDVGSKYKSPPFLLTGGFQKFLYAYPHMVTNPKARAPDRSVASTLTPTTLNVNYPDLNSGFLVTPSPSPQSVAAISSGAIKISRDPVRSGGTSEARYPSISSDLNSLTPKSAPRSTTPTGTSLTNKFVAPSIPDRSTKPVTSDQSKDEFNEARQSFDIDRSDSNSSVSSTWSSADGNSLLNNAFELSKGTAGMPRVDRGSKKEAMLRYYGVEESSLENVESVQQAQLNVVDRSLQREKEKLDLENKWEYLRLRREAEAENVLRLEIQEEQEKLVKELDRLAVENKEKEDTEKKLTEELEKLKLQLKEKDEKVKSYQRNEEERKRAELELHLRREKQKEMYESVQNKRRERKRRESEMRGQDSREHRGAAGTRQRLRDEGDRSSGGGGLKRSFSSPNIAKMLEQEGGDLRSGYSGVPIPKFDRTNKPSQISSRNFAGVWGTQKPGLTGLKNLGNTCYMNSILQCVSNTPPLAHYFVSRSFEEDINEKYSKTRGHIAREFAEVLKHLWSSQYKSISAGDLKSRVGRAKTEFAGRDQQDSHEFLLSLLEWLHDDTNKVAKPNNMPEQNSKDKSDVTAARRHWRNYLERNQSIIVQLFCGQTRSVVKCFLCLGESVTYREFTNLTLPLPESSNRTTLRDCLEMYLKEERIDEFKCDLCKRTGRVSKKTDIVKFPPLLIIHLSRFYQDGMYTRKKQNFVNFDLRNLDLSHHVVSGFDNQFSRFNLYAVSNHFGNLEGGHYTAYASSDVHKKWYKFDDQDVSVMDPADVVTPAGYILFYSAIEGQTSLPPLG